MDMMPAICSFLGFSTEVCGYIEVDGMLFLVEQFNRNGSAALNPTSRDIISRVKLEPIAPDHQVLAPPMKPRVATPRRESEGYGGAGLNCPTFPTIDPFLVVRTFIGGKFPFHGAFARIAQLQSDFVIRKLGITGFQVGVSGIFDPVTPGFYVDWWVGSADSD